MRVNTLYPGPIESERIRTVFAAMDTLREEDSGTTAAEFFDLMLLARARDGRPPERTFPSVLDVANVVLFLGSDESAAIAGHDVEVTHGMAVRKESRSTWLSRPSQRTVDGTGRTALLAGGEQVADAIAIARILAATGAKVLLGLERDEDVRAAASSLGPGDAHITPVLVDRTRPDTLARTLEAAPSRIDGAIILPAMPPGRLRGALTEVSDADLDAFLDRELVGALAISRELARYWQSPRGTGRGPRVVFISNADDGAGNLYADALRAGLEELCRVWRQEGEVRTRGNTRHRGEWSNQIIRYVNGESEGLAFAAGQTARLLFTPRHIREVNLYVPASIVAATGARRASLGWMDNLNGLHLGKVALVTGGSGGIGAQIGRLLACAGARVMLVARGEAQLAEKRDQIVAELSDCGYSGAAERVHTLAGVDVADLAAAERALDVTLQTFGRIDYLINCAGIAGAEEMVVDMALEDWRRTLDANLVSNYALIQKVVPHMKAQGSGYVVNVSSYFGGEKYVATAYPNRADYAVSKAGQRALAENFARLLGPEIQINAIAPGPVAGERLQGQGGKPGLYERRAKLILENKRLNRLHAALVTATRWARAGGAARSVRQEPAPRAPGDARVARGARRPVHGRGARRRLVRAVPHDPRDRAEAREPTRERRLHQRQREHELRRRVDRGAPRAAGAVLLQAVHRRGGGAGQGRRAVDPPPAEDADRDGRGARHRLLPRRPRRVGRDVPALGRTQPRALEHGARALRKREEGSASSS